LERAKPNALQTKHNSSSSLKVISFLQEMRSVGSGSKRLGGVLSAQARKDKAVSILKNEAQRLGSTALSTLAMRVNADPLRM